MLPECRTRGDLFSIPKFTIEMEDVEDFIKELKGFHGRCKNSNRVCKICNRVCKICK